MVAVEIESEPRWRLSFGVVNLIKVASSRGAKFFEAFDAKVAANQREERECARPQPSALSV